MKNFVATLFLIFLAAISTRAQVDLQWSHVYSAGAPWTTSFRESVTDNAGNIYVLGFNNASTDLNPDTGVTIINPHHDFFIAKYNSNGNLIFAKPINYNLPDKIMTQNLYIDKSNNIYVLINNNISSYNDTICVDSNNVNACAYFPYLSFGVVKYDSNGNFVKLSVFEAAYPSHYISFANLFFDNNNNLFFFGCYHGIVDIDLGPAVHNTLPAASTEGKFILKVDSMFSYIDAFYFIGDVGFDGLHTDSNNNLVFWGSFQNIIDFNPGIGTINLSYPTGMFSAQRAPFILKLDSAGNYIDVKAFLSSRVRINDLKINNNNSVSIIGTISGGTDSVDLDPGLGVFDPVGICSNCFKSFFLKLDYNMDFQWCKTIGTTYNANVVNLGKRLNALSDGSFIIVAMAEDIIPQQNEFNFPYIDMKLFDGGYFISKLDSSGNSKWFVPINHHDIFLDYFSGLIDDSTFYIAGYTHYVGTFDLDFGPGIVPVTTQYSGKAYMAKYKIQDHSSCNISGLTYIDYNNDSTKQSNEPPLPFQVIKVQPGPVFVSSNVNGYYSVYLETGNYTVSSPIPPPNFNFSVPFSYTANLPLPNITIDTLNFAFYPFEITNDLQVDITPVTPVMPNHACVYKLTYGNKATNVMSGQVILKYDSALTFTGSSVPPNYSNADSLRWNFSNLNPFISNDINVFFNVDSSATIGNYVTNIAKVQPIIADITPINNVDTSSDLITGSFMPNRIDVEPDCDFDVSEIQSGVWLTYTIRFQNTGFDTVSNVTILDTLQKETVIQSFKLIAASHPYTFELFKDNVALFKFSNINLPRKLTNEPGSFGFIKFRMKVKKTLPVGTEIKNTAHIYFDYVIPAATNTTVNSVVNVASVNENDFEQPLFVYPNPVTDFLQIQSSAYLENALIELSDVTGKVFYQTHSNISTQNSFALNLKSYSKGVYVLRVATSEKDFYRKVLKQ